MTEFHFGMIAGAAIAMAGFLCATLVVRYLLNLGEKDKIHRRWDV